MKLINPDKGRRHDYSEAGNIAHMHVSMGETYDVKFKDLDTHGWDGIVRTPMFVDAGDFIYKKMTSGNVGVYEIVKVLGFKVANDLGEPFRDYSCKVVLCGYLDDNGKTIKVFRGYGDR